MKTEDLIRIGKDYFKTVAVEGIKVSAVASFPFLASPPFYQFMDAFLNWLIEKIADILEERSFFLYTDFRTSAQGKAFVDAKMKGLKAELEGRVDDLKKAQEEIKRTFRTFARFDS